MKIRNICMLLFSFAVILAGCGHRTINETEKSYIVKGDTFYLQSDLLSEKIRMAEVTTEPFVKEVITSGTVQAIPTQFAYIAPPFPGRVIKSHVRLGQRVGMNTPLFEIISPDFTSAQKDFYRAQSEHDLAQKDLKRKEDLIKNGVGSQKELEEARNVWSITEKEYENSIAALNVYQTDPHDMVLGQALIIRSPIPGDIIENRIVAGQYVNSDSEPVAVVADLSKVWVVAQVKERDIRFIHEGNDMDIQISAFPGKTVRGIVYHIDELVDEETRSIKVLSVCDNKEGLLKLGMYTTVHFLDKPADCMTVPEKALLQSDKDSYVFVQVAEKVFVRTPVETEEGKNGRVVVTVGLKQGDKIIGEGGYYLK